MSSTATNGEKFCLYFGRTKHETTAAATGGENVSTVITQTIHLFTLLKMCPKIHATVHEGADQIEYSIFQNFSKKFQHFKILEPTFCKVSVTLKGTVSRDFRPKVFSSRRPIIRLLKYLRIRRIAHIHDSCAFRHSAGSEFETILEHESGAYTVPKSR
jgi:hypothetical protein